MLRSAASKVMWVGRATVFLVGLAVILALLFGVAASALAGTGVGDVFNLGQKNTVDRASQLVGGTTGAMLRVDNDGSGTALDLRVGDLEASPATKTVAPMRVDSQARVANLNADELDGLNSGQLLLPRGYAHITLGGAVDTAYPSKGVNDVVVPDGSTNLYCFDLTFTPNAAVGSPYFTNSAVVATVTPPNSGLSSCPVDHRDAAVRTFRSDNGSPEAINFQVVFV